MVKELFSEARAVGAVLKNSLRMEPAHFEKSLPRNEAVGLFNRHVELVEVETTSYCNRQCSFCPNSTIDRRSEKNPMPASCWQAILDDLGEAAYSGTFVWARYSEPTSEAGLIDRIAQLRAAAPKVRICISTNGDYLDEDYLRRLIDAGLDRAWVDIYIPDGEIPDGEAYDLNVAKKYHANFLKRINKTATITATYPELAATIHVANLEITSHARNVNSLARTHISNRGGLVQLGRPYQRVSPCFAPFKHLAIDWDGSALICCQVRSDAVEHEDTVVARVGENGVGLIDAYVALADWRNSLKGYGPKKSPCSSCNHFAYSPNRAAQMASGLVVDERFPAAALLKGIASKVIGKTARY